MRPAPKWHHGRVTVVFSVEGHSRYRRSGNRCHAVVFVLELLLEARDVRSQVVPSPDPKSDGLRMVPGRDQTSLWADPDPTKDWIHGRRNGCMEHIPMAPV
jgi:hypothetical protein